MEISTLQNKTATIPQNAGHQSPGDAASHPRRMKTSTTTLQKSENSHHSYLLANVTLGILRIADSESQVFLHAMFIIHYIFLRQC
jgi:hypothetical protein